MIPTVAARSAISGATKPTKASKISTDALIILEQPINVVRFDLRDSADFTIIWHEERAVVVEAGGGCEVVAVVQRHGLDGRAKVMFATEEAGRGGGCVDEGVLAGVRADVRAGRPFALVGLDGAVEGLG